MNRRDLLLQQMGISQWRLRRPEALKGAVNIAVDAHIRLIVMAEQKPDPGEKIVKDILLSAQLKPQDCLFIEFDQAHYLNVRQPVNYWLLTQNNEKIDRTSALCTQAISLWQSPDLAELKQNPQAKRRLWRHIQTALSGRN